MSRHPFGGPDAFVTFPQEEDVTMRHRSSAVVWLTAFVLAGVILLADASAQVFAPPGAAQPGPAPDPDGSRGPSTRELVKRLNRGKQLLAEKNYAEGARVLQTIIESDEDAFFYPDPENKTVERSLKLEAQTLIGAMPAEGRE